MPAHVTWPWAERLRNYEILSGAKRSLYLEYRHIKELLLMCFKYGRMFYLLNKQHTTSFFFFFNPVVVTFNVAERP